MTSFAYRVSAIAPTPASRVRAVEMVQAEASERLFFTLLQAFGFLAAGFALYYLYRAVRNRRREVPAAAGLLALAGPAIIAVAGIGSHLTQASAASAFLMSGPRTDARALELLSAGPARAFAYATLGGTLAFAFATVLVGANGLQAGLLSRFAGILGVILGFLYVLPIPPGPTVIQVFWFAALGGLFLDRWPGGRGPAWAAGEAMPWPPSARRGPAKAEPDSLDPASEPEGSTRAVDTNGAGGSEEPGSRKRRKHRRG